MAELTTEVQTFIVVELACYKSPQQVADLVKEEFGLDIPRQQVQHYDPTKTRRPAKKWCELFEKTRAALQEGTADIPIAHKLYRLRELQAMYRKAVDMNNLVLARELLEQAAKEVGEYFTNTRVLSGPGGGPLKHAHLNLSPEDLKEANLTDLVRAYFEFDQGEK